MTLVGRTALSVEMKTKWPTPWASAARATFVAPPTLLSTACGELSSRMGTCL